MRRTWPFLFCVIGCLYAAHAQSADSLSFRHFELRFGLGLSVAKTTSNYQNFMSQSGSWVDDNNDPYESASDASVVKGNGMTAIVEYFPIRRFAIGLAFASLGSVIGQTAHARGYMTAIHLPSSYYDLDLEEEFASRGFFLVATFIPFTVKNAYSEMTCLLTAGMGINNIDVTYRADQSWYSGYPLAERAVHMNPFGLYALASIEQEVLAHVALGVSIEYRFIPVQTISAATMPMTLQTWDATDAYYELQLPAHSINFSDWKIGIISSFHW